MADNIDVVPGTGATVVPVATDEINNVHHQLNKLEFGGDGVATMVSAADPLPVTGPVTDTQLRAADVKVTLDGETVMLGAGTATIGATKDAGPAWTPSFGVSGAAVLSANATGGVDVTDAPTSGQKLVIDDIVVSTDTAMAVTLEEETTGTDKFKLYLAANSTAQITLRNGVKLDTVNKKLRAVASVAGNVSVSISYHSSEA